MQFSLQYNQGIFDVKTESDADVETFSEIIKEIFNHEKWESGNPMLIDHTKLNAATLTAKDMESIAFLCGQYREQFRHTKCAIIAVGDLEYAMGRMWQAFAETELRDSSVMIFKSRAEAIAWLNE